MCIRDSFTGIELGKVILYIPKGSRAAYEAVAPWNQMDIYDVLEPPTGIENTEITAIGILSLIHIFAYSIFGNRCYPDSSGFHDL